MTYHSGATTQTYEFTAFSEIDLQNAGVSGSVSCGDSFTMPASASLCFKVEDNDARLSGDGKRWSNDKASDNSYQTAEISAGADGPDIGNGGQIYAEKYFWVCDEDGNWYVLIEIEQEGSSENYYTFHTDYGIPPADAVLTVSAPCNIGRSGVKFDDLGAGDCAPTPPQNDDCITIEAEDMHLWGYDVQYLDGASGGKVVKADYCAPASYAMTQFNGADGTYDLKLTVLDEADGQGEINIYINGVLVSSVVLDEDSGGIYGETGVFREIVLDDIELKAGDKITIEGVRDGCEFARIDKLEICKDDTPLPAALGDQDPHFQAHQRQQLEAVHRRVRFGKASVESSEPVGRVVEVLLIDELHIDEPVWVVGKLGGVPREVAAGVALAERLVEVPVEVALVSGDAPLEAARVAQGVDLLPPDMANVERLNSIIYDELMVGKVTRDAQRQLKTIITNKAKEGADAIVLACTELDLVVDVDANVLPVFDSTRIHCEAAANWILEQE